MDEHLPVGKLPPELLARLINLGQTSDPRLLIGPGIGLDCAVLDFGERLLVLKTDPITFATAEIGWYAVHVNANDIATTGGEPRWMMMTLLLPENAATPALAETIAAQVHQACRELGITVVGGHTEITYGLDRPILVGCMLGEVERSELIVPTGAAPGDRVLLTKGVPLEAAALLAREFPSRLEGVLSPAELEQARSYLHDPGLSVLRDARLARRSGRVTAMHDPTEGGLLAALWELAEASGRALRVDLSAAPVPDLARRICQAFDLDPYAAIASGALLLTAGPSDAARICRTLQGEGITCAELGAVDDGPAGVYGLGEPAASLPRPARDEITKVFEG
jgi:hydrogenase expression/formation protein HypE